MVSRAHANEMRPQTVAMHPLARCPAERWTMDLPPRPRRDSPRVDRVVGAAHSPRGRSSEERAQLSLALCEGLSSTAPQEIQLGHVALQQVRRHLRALEGVADSDARDV